MPSPPPDPKPHPSVPLADILGTHRSLTSFSSVTRMHPSSLASDVLSQTATASSSTTIVLAPLNSAIDALPRKPWEDPDDYAALGQSAYDGAQGQDRANANLRRFVDRHLVVVEAAAAGWPRGQRATSLAGRELWWDDDGSGNRFVMPDHVEVERVASRVATGEVWMLKGVLQPATRHDSTQG
ncbi:hypothetical protein HRG_001266 [Hirsutella rhossiliensis]|uniref:FAS1 domain-containing protein n=1 Tax=Hirsutella rhossiliensis TaxID=111463 RepID=A0A9P8NAC1_9HYPO|nr:uncharacterized protein HRG_01266 [Hirsutella rhossiliensis]KAH0968624.1 hypothetical protein HRG_01266 [Hirsutella rhossiliensis]